MPAVPNSYLFTAYFADGTEYVQGVDDVSIQDATKNAFYDIGIMPIKEVVGFSISAISHEDGRPSVVGVDLRNGEFNIDGVSVFLHHNGEAFHKREVYFARDIQQHRVVAVSSGEVQQDFHSLHYLIGWKSGSIERFVRV